MVVAKAGTSATRWWTNAQVAWTTTTSASDGSGWGRVNALSERYRMDLFAAGGRPTGYAIVDPDAGRVEFFNRNSRLMGSGSLDKKGRVTMFDLSGRRRSDTVLPV